MLEKDPSEITEKNLNELKSNAVPESKTLDYKADLSLDSKDEKKEFVADLTAFANQEGGSLLFGIVEEGGVPTEIRGLSIVDIDEFILKMEHILRDFVEPRLVGYKIGYATLANTNKVIIIKIIPAGMPPTAIDSTTNFTLEKQMEKIKWMWEKCVQHLCQVKISSPEFANFKLIVLTKPMN
ncbi:MAG: ATPase AAA [Promethearchaeota archaeon CR_4]|nr:MAG: ATPase AAA [Candidatus Lokiarchaeota archaeon CR_4]